MRGPNFCNLVKRMANRSFIHYLQAHGYSAGPTQRPYLTGATSGLIAIIPAILVLAVSGAFRLSADALDIDGWWLAVASGVLMVVAGVIYAAIFQRAANDRSGGWMFGMSYGFLVWMLSPITIWQLASSHPFIVGSSAIGAFGAGVIYGLVLGLVFPHINRLFERELGDLSGAQRV